MLEEEVYGANSPIWDVDFAQNAVHGSTTNGAGKCHIIKKICFAFLSLLCPQEGCEVL